MSGGVCQPAPPEALCSSTFIGNKYLNAVPANHSRIRARSPSMTFIKP